MAARFMSATLKFSKSDTKSLLNASGNQSKLLELAMLDDEEIAELSSGGSARGIELDDIATMTVTELRAALREAKADAEATGRVLEEKNKKIDELATDKKKRKTATPWPTQFADLNDEISQIGSVADEVMGKHLTFIDAVEALYESTPEEHIGAAKSSVHRIGDAVARLCYLAASLRDQYEARLVGYVVEDRTHILTDDAS